MASKTHPEITNITAPPFTCHGGPFGVSSYGAKQGLPTYIPGTDYGSATIYMPVDDKGSGSDPALPSVIIGPGGFSLEQGLSSWAQFLASHGFVVMNTGTRDPRNVGSATEGGGVHRGRALLSAARVLRGEHSREGSPLKGRLDLNRIAVMGLSNGGSGALHAAIADPLNIKACVSIVPGGPNDLPPTVACERGLLQD